MLPGRNLDLCQIFDEKTPIDGDLLRLLPGGVSVDLIIVTVPHGALVSFSPGD